MNALPTARFSNIIRWLTTDLSTAPLIDSGEWQAIQGAPQGRMIEVEDVSFEWAISHTMEDLQAEIGPNLPWAETHFLERISGEPLNPPPSHEIWPFARKNNDDHRRAGKFSHTYPERFWPRYANMVTKIQPHFGIRFPYGDLADLITLLRDRPGTRQAFLPVWFPEDGYAARMGERVPCTLGYHFLIRDDYLKCVYYIRSCDFIRHFRDDVYMAARLTQYIAGELTTERVESVGHEQATTPIKPGNLVMHISSLHAFEPEREKLTRMAKIQKEQALLEGLG